MPENAILKKLLLKSNHRAVVLDAPESYGPVLAEIPEGVELAKTLEGEFDFIHAFASDRAELERKVPALKGALKPAGLLWISYPKGKTVPTDLNRDRLREAVEAFGLKAVTLVAIDDVWSAMRFKLV